MFESDTTFFDLFSQYLCFALFVQSSLIPRARSGMSSIFVRFFTWLFFTYGIIFLSLQAWCINSLLRSLRLMFFTQTSFLSLELICIMVNITIFAGYYGYSCHLYSLMGDKLLIFTDGMPSHWYSFWSSLAGKVWSLLLSISYHFFLSFLLFWWRLLTKIFFYVYDLLIK